MCKNKTCIKSLCPLSARGGGIKALADADAKNAIFFKCSSKDTQTKQFLQKCYICLAIIRIECNIFKGSLICKQKKVQLYSEKCTV